MRESRRPPPFFKVKPRREISGAFLYIIGSADLFEGYAVADVNRDGFHLEIIFHNVHADYTGMTIQGFALIEDEIADTVVDFVALEVFDGL